MNSECKKRIHRSSAIRNRSRERVSVRRSCSRDTRASVRRSRSHSRREDDRQSRSKSRSPILPRRRERRVRTPPRNTSRPSRIDGETYPPRICRAHRSRSPVRGFSDAEDGMDMARSAPRQYATDDRNYQRNRSRDRSQLRRQREQSEECEALKRRLAALESQLGRERVINQRRRNENRVSEPRNSPEPKDSRYDSASLFFNEFAKFFKNKPGDREHFPSHMNNVIPEFDPLLKQQTIQVWLDKVDECAEIYEWSDKQIVHYALPKLIGHAKLWYQGLPSLKRTWMEWKQLLKESFPSTENYADLLTEMLGKRARFGDNFELYYYNKINLLNRCKIFGPQAVDCLIHGVDDRGVRVGAQAAKFKKPEDVLEFFKSVRDNNLRRDRQTMNSNMFSRPKISEQPGTSKQLISSQPIVCFNCKQKGHPSFKCPKPLVKCSLCQLIGHTAVECRKKNNPESDNKDKTVLKVLKDHHETEVQLSNSISTEKDLAAKNKYNVPIQINDQTVVGLVDLGSEATLLRQSDALRLKLTWEPVDGPYLRGLGNIPYLPEGRTFATVTVQGVVEKDVEIFIVTDQLINYPILLGHSFSERPNLRITKTATELIFDRVPLTDTECPSKVPLRATCDVLIPANGLKTVHVKSSDVVSFRIYVPGSVRGCSNREYYLLPGEYQIVNGECHLLVHNLCSNDIHLPEDTLITRVIALTRELRINLTEYDCSPACTINYGSQLSTEHKHKLDTLLTEFKDCFSSGMHDLGFTTETEMVIQLKDSDPVVYRPYRLSFSERRKVQDMIDEMVDCGIVRHSSSPYASPIVLIKKKTGDLRLCVDYRALNSKTKRDHYPLPRIDDLLDQLSGQTIFTTLDLASGYHQIPIASESIERTAFVTPDGQYEYTRMPFGLANAPAVFQRLIHKVLGKAGIKHTIVYMDDILIPSKSIDEGLDRLKDVLKALRDSGLTLKLEKCHFFKESIDFLGFEISKGEIRPGAQKTLAVAQFAPPQNQHDLRRFLGLASFFRRFVKDFASIARPLTDLLRKNTPWRWSQNEEGAFIKLKDNLTKRPILALYNHAAETQLHTDASQIGVAGILLQRLNDEPFRPVAYFSRRTTADEQKLHSFELETLAVVFSLNKFRVYLLGIKFTIFTDCHALRTTFTKRDLIPRISRWWIQFLEYDCSIEYRPGDRMAHVDCLSRSPVETEESDVHNLDVLRVDAVDWITTVQSGDSEITRIKEILEDPETAKIASIRKDYKIKNGRVFRIIDDTTDRWVVPRAVRWQLLRANHDDVGHFGFEKTLERVRASYWFPKMRKFVKKYVSACLGCAHHKIPSGAKEGELHPIPKVEIPFHTVHADHLGPFVRSKKRNVHLLVIVDAFTKYVNLTPVRSTKSKASIKVFRHYFSLFGIPTRLITDRGTSFTSRKFKSFVDGHGIKHIMNSVATPRANGQVERYNRTILSALGAMTHDKGAETWDEYIPDIQIGINTSVHAVTKKTPTELLFGRNVSHASQGVLNDVALQADNTSEKTLDEVRAEASSRIAKNQEINKSRYDLRRKRATNYKEGDLVRIIKAVPSGTGQSKKLEPKCQGPYKIKKILPNDRFVVVDTPLTRKGRPYEGVISIDKMFPWLSFSANYTSSEESGEEYVPKLTKKGYCVTVTGSLLCYLIRI
ncbi:uncharacterized protein LOC114362443 [Ostrinia furnacalis]|uniref:uncharacterized protein LOC114362443 n=1 Tax=Ostrinia furnacalis TaxID=93504 RepID=UPI001038C723|nr:uncharacterized protein LOC114362443 [Ostrinia furnacalis]